MAGSPRVEDGEQEAAGCRGDGGKPGPTAPGRRGHEPASSGRSRLPPLRRMICTAWGKTSAGGWPHRLHHLRLTESAHHTGSGRWTRIEDSWVVEQRVGWCAMRRGGEPWRGLLII